MEEKIRREVGTPVAPGQFRITIDLKGPILVYGNPPIRQMFVLNDEEGAPWYYQFGAKNYDTGKEPVALCRCGASRRKPYCDGAHAHVAWDPDLGAPRRPLLENADLIPGPTVDLTDNELYCAFARFCDAKGRVWNLIQASDDPTKRETAIRETLHCPAGRLKVWDKATGKTIEAELKPEIGLIEDSPLRISGALYVRGGIPITTSDGYTYEIRNRVTLCRCGMSSNKPFCNGAHASIRFHDGLPDNDRTDETE